MVLYSSEEGTGKSSFFKFISKVIGEGYCYFGNVDAIFDKHSSSFVGKLINVLEEVERNKHSEKLKELSASSRRNYNPKGQKDFQVNNFVRIFINKY